MEKHIMNAGITNIFIRILLSRNIRSGVLMVFFLGVYTWPVYSQINTKKARLSDYFENNTVQETSSSPSPSFSVPSNSTVDATSTASQSQNRVSYIKTQNTPNYPLREQMPSEEKICLIPVDPKDASSAMQERISHSQQQLYHQENNPAHSDAFQPYTSVPPAVNNVYGSAENNPANTSFAPIIQTHSQQRPTGYHDAPNGVRIYRNAAGLMQREYREPGGTLIREIIPDQSASTYKPTPADDVYHHRSYSSTSSKQLYYSENQLKQTPSFINQNTPVQTLPDVSTSSIMREKTASLPVINKTDIKKNKLDDNNTTVEERPSFSAAVNQHTNLPRRITPPSRHDAEKLHTNINSTQELSPNSVKMPTPCGLLVDRKEKKTYSPSLYSEKSPTLMAASTPVNPVRKENTIAFSSKKEFVKRNTPDVSPALKPSSTVSQGIKPNFHLLTPTSDFPTDPQKPSFSLEIQESDIFTDEVSSESSSMNNTEENIIRGTIKGSDASQDIPRMNIRSQDFLLASYSAEPSGTHSVISYIPGKETHVHEHCCGLLFSVPNPILLTSASEEKTRDLSSSDTEKILPTNTRPVLLNRSQRMFAAAHHGSTLPVKKESPEIVLDHSGYLLEINPPLNGKNINDSSCEKKTDTSDSLLSDKKVSRNTSPQINLNETEKSSEKKLSSTPDELPLDESFLAGLQPVKADSPAPEKNDAEDISSDDNSPQIITEKENDTLSLHSEIPANKCPKNDISDHSADEKNLEADSHDHDKLKDESEDITENKNSVLDMLPKNSDINPDLERRLTEIVEDATRKAIQITVEQLTIQAINRISLEKIEDAIQETSMCAAQNALNKIALAQKNHLDPSENKLYNHTTEKMKNNDILRSEHPSRSETESGKETPKNVSSDSPNASLSSEDIPIYTPVPDNAILSASISKPTGSAPSVTTLSGRKIPLLTPREAKTEDSAGYVKIPNRSAATSLHSQKNIPNTDNDHSAGYVKIGGKKKTSNTLGNKPAPQINLDPLGDKRNSNLLTRTLPDNAKHQTLHGMNTTPQVLPINPCRGAVVSTQNKITVIHVENPDICDVIPLAAEKFSIIGKRTGSTLVTVKLHPTKKESSPMLIKVNVGTPENHMKKLALWVQTVEKAYQKYYPDSHISCMLLGCKLFIKGNSSPNVSTDRLLNGIQASYKNFIKMNPDVTLPEDTDSPHGALMIINMFKK